MFETLPDKIKKLYQDKIKEDESKQKGNDDNNMSKIFLSTFFLKKLNDNYFIFR
jgi:hypothetical protein